MTLLRISAMGALILLAACREEAALPAPVTMTEDAIGHYCQMNLTEHPGPKAQVHLKDGLFPLFFSQVRDAIAYQRMPEQAAEIAVIYVSDMATAPSWDDPGDDNWLVLEDAVFVAGSRREGGMGAPEIVPFSDPDAADRFVAEYGGYALKLDQISDAEVLVAQDRPITSADEDASPDDGHADDYAARLRALSPQSEVSQ
ncbi:MAG: nitrous oxide reductase accessory protein NosL [Paracoccus sp. (in: a-proteobacteria)]|nr:nitrous oxide reductase accessory protein NosL [Paracoccus sp. (in: a-proteobacteria)]